MPFPDFLLSPRFFKSMTVFEFPDLVMHVSRKSSNLTTDEDTVTTF